MARKQGYSGLQIGLHWVVAVLIAAAFITHEDMGRALRSRLESGETGAPLHVWFGIAALVFIALRIVVRAFHGAPPPPAGQPHWADLAAIWGHRVLYLLMIAAPLLGIAAWYGGLRSAGDVHEVVGKALVILAAAHAAVAILHAILRRDGVLTRMVRPQV
ncbi:cytochrome b [Sagittula stellata]|uniref:Cytochrome b562 n=1 Tax=Sagittula stellata (strain ATCC 700073 / DSM 11524 / E-37) TaxID=388399 RepID=A3K8J3_SAGS3|nr:cytochrome b/b6 domain-containing protein [Sagittula stellata]EBA06431.1 cytochrome b562 [Sagittula stellata E-37]